MRERRLEQVRRVLAQEHGVGDVWVGNSAGIEQRDGDLVRLDELEHARAKQRLELESALVISVSEHEEDILHDVEEVLLEEGIRD